MMKDFIAKLGITVLVTLVLLAGWFIFWPSHAENYPITHQEFFEFSLGEYEVEVVRRWILEGARYTRWDLHYRCQAGEEQVLYLGNFMGLEDFIWWHVEGRAREYAKEIERQYFSPDEIAAGRVEIAPIRDFWKSWSPDLYDPQTGIRLHTITPREMVADWGLGFRVSASSHDPEAYEDVADRLKAMTRTLAASVEQDRVWISFTLSDPERRPWEQTVLEKSFRGHYYRQSDTFEIQTRGEEIRAGFADYPPSHVDASFLAELSPQQLARAEEVLSGLWDWPGEHRNVDGVGIRVFVHNTAPFYAGARIHRFRWSLAASGRDPELSVDINIHGDEQRAIDAIAESMYRRRRGILPDFHPFTHVENDNGTEALLYSAETSDWHERGLREIRSHIRIGHIEFFLRERQWLDGPMVDLSGAFMTLLYELLKTEE